MKITIYELLGMVKDGKAPKKIKWEDQEWEYNPINDYEGIKYGGCLLNQVTLDRLNDRVEILEEENERLKQEISNLKFILSGHWEDYEKGDDTNDN